MAHADYQSLTDDLDDLVKEVTALIEQKKFAEALEKCEKASTAYPKDSRPRFLSGSVYLVQDKFDQASEEFGKAILLDPGSRMLYMLKAYADIRRNKPDEALAAARKAVKVDPTYAAAHRMIGDLLRHDEKHRDEAIAAYRSAIKADPSQSETYQVLYYLLSSVKDTKGMEEILRLWMAADPENMQARFELGRFLVEQGNLKEARELWEGRSSDYKDNTFPNLITVLERAEKLKAASEALNAKPDDPETLLAMGYAVMDGDHWVVDGRQERAITHFKKALDIRPDFAKAQYAICKAYVQIADTYAKKNVELDAEISKLRKMDPDLAIEIDEYRKTYKGGLRGLPPPKPAAKN
jgi:tetratricopeptide (TPR) repeat protein